MFRAMKHVFIVNPAAGKSDRTEIYRKLIDAAFVPRGLQYELLVSQAPGDCRKLAQQAAASGEEVRLYACGGDGTLNEVVCGMAGFENAAVTHYPGGSGNDSIKVFSDTAPFFDLERLLDADETRFDLISCNGTYCANILSIGLDAKIGTDIARFKRLPFVSGKGAYILSILANVLSGRSAHYVVEVNGERIDAEQTLICVCNGRWYGGGFNPVPEAEPDDGLLDVLLVKKVSLLQVAAVIGKYQKGKYADYPALIRHERCTKLTIRCDTPSVVNIDGEALHTDFLDISLKPKALRFFYPKGLTYRLKAE